MTKLDCHMTPETQRSILIGCCLNLLIHRHCRSRNLSHTSCTSTPFPTTNITGIGSILESPYMSSRWQSSTNIKTSSHTTSNRSEEKKTFKCIYALPCIRAVYPSVCSCLKRRLSVHIVATALNENSPHYYHQVTRLRVVPRKRAYMAIIQDKA
jgi:hypothetical protein